VAAAEEEAEWRRPGLRCSLREGTRAGWAACGVGTREGRGRRAGVRKDGDWRVATGAQGRRRVWGSACVTV
jgi:hypothetical protein